MAKDIEISDEKVKIAFKSIMLRVVNETIEDMTETDDVDNLNSSNFIYLLEEKFEKLLAESD